jgi:ABC-type lipoprotein export system ATPase subunit
MPVFDNLSLDIEAGTKVAVVGRSGVGKSTLLYLLGLLWEGDLESGQIVYYDIRDGACARYDYRQITNPVSRSQLRMDHFGFVFQSSPLLTHLTCLENIALPLIIKGVSRRIWEPVAWRLIEQIECIDGELKTLAPKAAIVSTGQRQRFAVLRAMVHDPRVIFADEPFSNLDHNNTSVIMDLFQRWHRGELAVHHNNARTAERTLILVTHDFSEAWNLCDRFVIFHPNGSLVGQKLWTKEELRAAGGIDCLAQ